MLKFFACYIWLGFGFLLAFKIIFSEERTFAGFPIPLITMLVMMLGELEHILLSLGEKLEREEVDILIKECCDPEDDDGFIPYERKYL